MSSVGDTQASLISAYLDLKSQQKATEGKLAQLEERIAAFSREHKLKTLRSSTHLLYVIQKFRTVFPSKGSPERKRVEELVQDSSDRDKVMAFDVVKLATAYDQKKLSSKLIKLLKPFAKREKFLKISATESPAHKQMN